MGLFFNIKNKIFYWYYKKKKEQNFAPIFLKTPRGGISLRQVTVECLLVLHKPKQQTYCIVSFILRTELKTVKEQIDTCPDERAELKAEYQFRYDVMSEFAPKLLSAEEVKKILEEKFAEVLATKNKGMIMKAVMAELKGKADGKVINQVVAELCK